ncbi:hypothetical protein L5515_005168 [Caenorhabditis briggsae]|uniref:Uncharacterized protein n=1 Tax=Caenorhabditis briggsae TaxID=6238 RepID=A0AAE9JEI5_CAEBR|nr:hypothetical protein L5515_005168 [Caenorhabditis briggsae]
MEKLKHKKAALSGSSPHTVFNSRELDDLSFEELAALEETLIRRDTDISSSEVTALPDSTLEAGGGGGQRSKARRTAGGPIYYLELLKGSVSKNAGSSGVSSREPSGALFGAFSGASSGEKPGASSVESSGLSDKKMDR